MRDSYALYTEQLQGKYKEVFKQIEKYVGVQSVDTDTAESSLSELLDTFLNAQDEGMPVEKIVGEDLEVFCKNFCAEFGMKNKIIRLIDIWKNIAWIIFIFGIIDAILTIFFILTGEAQISEIWSTESSWNMTGFLIGFFIISLIYALLHQVTGKIIFKLKKGTLWKKIWTGIEVIVFVVCFVILYQMQMNEQFNFLKVPPLILAAVSGLYLVGYYVLNRKNVQARKKNKISTWKMLQDNITSGIPTEFELQMEKQFQKKNAKLIKKGKMPLSREEFINQRETEMVKTLKWKWLYDWTPICIALIMGVFEFLNNGFSIDLIIFILILFVIEFVIFKGIWKAVSASVKTNMVWIEMQRKSLAEVEIKEDITK